MSEGDSTAWDIARDIENYLRRHPSAADTAPGIQRCWLSNEWAEASIERVEEALDILVMAGVVVKREVLGGSVMYAARVH